MEELRYESLEEITRDLILTAAYYDHMVARVIYRDFEHLCALRNKPITSIIERENEFNEICDEIVKGFLLLDRDVSHDGDPFLGYLLSDVFTESYKDDWAESVGLTVQSVSHVQKLNLDVGSLDVIRLDQRGSNLDVGGETFVKKLSLIITNLVVALLSLAWYTLDSKERHSQTRPPTARPLWLCIGIQEDYMKFSIFNATLDAPMWVKSVTPKLLTWTLHEGDALTLTPGDIRILRDRWGYSTGEA